MKNIFSIVFVIIGSIIGAGFASGQEIYLFFYQFGYKGLFGILVSSILMGIIVFSVFRLIQRYNIENYHDFLERINQNNSKFKINKIINIIINLFLLISFYIMIAGFSAYFSQELNYPNAIGSLIIVCLCYFTFKNNIEGIVKVNSLIIPFLILFIFILGIKNVFPLQQLSYIEINSNENWLINAILYGSYNSIILIPLLITLKKYIKNNKQNLMISFTCVVIIILLATSIYFILSKIKVNITNIELPTVYVVSLMGNAYKMICGFIIIASIFTTAVSSGYGFLQNCSKTERTYQRLNLFICLSSVLISNIGFSNLVMILYPTFGILGLVQIFMIIKSNYQIGIEKKKEIRYK